MMAQSLKNMILGEPKIANSLAHLTQKVVKRVAGPYPIVAASLVSKALVRASWKRVVAKTNRETLPAPPEFSEVPLKEAYGPVVEKISGQIRNYVHRLATGELRATGMTADGRMVELLPSLWTHPAAALHLGGGDFLMLEGDQLHVRYRALMVDEAQKPVRLGRPKGRSYEIADRPLLKNMRKLRSGGKAHSISAAAKMVANDAIGGGNFESKVARLTRAYIKNGFK